MTGGSVSLEGERYAPGKPADAMKAGVAHVPEDRPVQAVFGELSVAENLTMSTVDALWRAWRLRRGLERSETERDIERFSIRTRAWDAPINSLSGGNQQKVILARWMRRSPRLLLLDEPTQGVDVGARAEIWSLVEAAIAADAAALVVLSDFDELLTVCHRVLVLRDGALLADVPASGLSIDDLNGLLHAEAR
jgi:ribose transport system ATP-binding protein